MRLALAKLRAIKQPVELSVMQAAIDLTIAGIELVKTNLTSYKYEYQVEADITANNLRNGAVDVWKPIVAAGKNSCILHSSDNQSPLRNGDMIVIDVGSEIEHYCSDITRTYAIGTQASPRQQAVYDAVKEIQAYGFSLQKPGSLIRENEALVEAFMGEQLRKLGLISSTERKAIRHYFPHATSHFLGLDPHDTGDYDAPLQAGMVLTVEPGIYIPEESIGVRIEDDVLITDTGYHVMSDALPRTIT
jgi:Xaa-Pro aminopeptidase